MNDLNQQKKELIKTINYLWMNPQLSKEKREEVLKSLEEIVSRLKL